MKKNWRWAILVGLGALLAPLCALRATGPGNEADRGPGRSPRRLELMKKDLGLSDEQASKLQEVLESARKAGDALRDQLKVSMEKLVWQVDAKAGEKDLEATIADVKKARKALADHEDKVDASLAGLLTAEQRARMLLAHPGGPGPRPGMGGRPGRPFGGPGPGPEMGGRPGCPFGRRHGLTPPPEAGDEGPEPDGD